MATLGTWWKTRGKPSVGSWLRIEALSQISLFDRSTLVLLVVTAIWYLAAYLGNPLTPGNNPVSPLGWMAWHDQNDYYQSTVHLAQGKIEPSDYWIGYSLLGVPFCGLMPKHPFFVPNLIFTLFMVGTFFASCRHFMGRMEAWVLVILFIFAERFMRDYSLVVPWNTLPTYAALYLSAYLLLFRVPTLCQFALCAAMGGLAVAARPAEVLPLAAIYLASLPRLGSWRMVLTGLLFFGIAGAIAGGINFGINLHLYGALNSPYMVSEKGKFHPGHYGLKVYQFLSDGSFLTGPATFPSTLRPRALLEAFPYFALMLPGVLFLIRRMGYPGWGLPSAIVITVAFYLLYTPFSNIPYFWSYKSYHYVWWMIPWLAFFTWLTFRQAIFHMPFRLFAGALVIPPVAFLFIGFKTVPLASWSPTRDEISYLSSYDERTFVVNFVTPGKGHPLDVRFEFSRPPSFHATDAESGRKIKVWVAGRCLNYMSDFMPSQHGNTVDISFLSRSRIPWPGERIVIAFTETDEPVVSEVSLQEAKFKWGRF